MSIPKTASVVDSTIHYRIIYKVIIRRFLKYFRRRYRTYTKYNAGFTIEKDFHIKGHGIE